MTLTTLLGVEVPIIQAPMAGVQKSRLAIAVSQVGGLGSLPCAMLDAATIRHEVEAIRTATAAPYNLNFFCHQEPVADPVREERWRAALGYYRATVRNSRPPARYAELHRDAVEALGDERDTHAQ